MHFGFDAVLWPIAICILVERSQTRQALGPIVGHPGDHIEQYTILLVRCEQTVSVPENNKSEYGKAGKSRWRWSQEVP